MTWRERQQYSPEGMVIGDDTYRKAHFKFVEFWVADYDLDGGRRQSIQKFPGDRYTVVQDLGRDSSQLSITAFLVGDEYDTQRNALETALLEGGVGQLRLPYREAMQVTIVGRIKVSEANQQRGYCTISFDCIETEEPPAVFTPDPASRVRESAGVGRDATNRRFLDRYSMQTLPETNRGKFRASLNSASEKVIGVQNRVSAFIAEIPKDASTISRLSGTLNDLINSPLDLSDEIVNAVITSYGALRSTTVTAENVVTTWGRGGPLRILADQTFRFADDFYSPTVPGLSKTAATERRNLDSFHLFTALNLFYEFADLLTRLPFESRRQALGLRSEYIDAIDPWVIQTEGLEYEAVAALNESVGSFLEEAARTLPELSTYTPPQVIPTLVAAHTIYGDAARELEIVVRNNVQHPGFLPADEPLEIVVA